MEQETQTHIEWRAKISEAKKKWWADKKMMQEVKKECEEDIDDDSVSGYNRDTQDEDNHPDFMQGSPDAKELIK